VESAAIYLRISEDRDGSRAGVRRQLEDCREWAARHGATVAEVYEDNDISAYRGKQRPRYRQMCEDIKAGLRDGVITWHLDRLHRSPLELEGFIALVESARIEVVTVTGGDYNLSTTDGRAMARVVGAFARKESEDKSRRITAQKIQAAKEGRRSGGGTRGYGYSVDHRHVVESEAAIIREAAERILAGDSLRSVCDDFNRREVPTVTGVEWSPTVLRTMLMSARLSGQVERHGEVVAAGDWPAILSPAHTRRLRSLLGDPGRRTNRSPRRYPLMGLVHCGRCGARMVARPRDDGRRRYVCAKAPGFTGCGGTFILADPLEELVTEGVLAALDTPQLRRALVADGPADAEIEALERRLADDRAQLEELAGMLGRKELSTSEWFAARGPVSSRIASAERQLGALSQSTALEGFVGSARVLRDQWQGLSVARRRAIFATLLDSITILPGTRGRNVFDPERVQPIWRV
jgi:DNA invertase Pin-like site-specific DNA recombinase